MTTAESTKGHSHVAMDTGLLVGDAAWLPHRLIDGGRSLRFVHAPRVVQRRVTFLSDDYLDATLPRVDLPVTDLKGALTPHDTCVHFVFHSAFARSTLLARALDLPGQAMALKEPIILNDAVDLARSGHLPGDILELILRLLERPLATGEAIILKPSNILNLLAPSLLRLRPKARAILMERPLKPFLLSIASKGMFGRVWARRQLALFHPHAPFDAGFSSSDLFVQTDLQAAAFGWLIQHAQFAALTRAMPDQVRMLDADAFTSDRIGTLVAAGQWFGLGISPRQAESIAAGAAFSHHSKQLDDRFASAAPPTASTHESEVGMVMDWIRAVADHVGVSLGSTPSTQLHHATL